MARDESNQDIETFGRELIASGFATSDSIIGCDSAEIAQVHSVAPEGFPIPDEYQAFLEYMGKKAGTLFRGTDLFFPRMLDAIEAAEDVSGKGLTLDGRFFFGHHQGYKVYFFKRGSGAVYAYQEGTSEDQKLADGFIEFLRQSWRIQQKTRESTEAMRRERHQM
ncbi:SMI1/KNR4 family protein [Nocardia salmonicida]|uniref:SMI1/KNR4 family protein n=1 Tax=Nocardia salmonicida TaxID=53431 RepID=UPI002E2B07C2|nr:SMI1/KNR4 family protein [Nocardia salmonicida]